MERPVSGTFPLYCPFDRRVTRHARRGPGGSIICVECGRSLEGQQPDSVARRPAPTADRPVRFAMAVRRPLRVPPRLRQVSAPGFPRRVSAAPFSLILVLGAVAAITSVYAGNQVFGPREVRLASTEGRAGTASPSAEGPTLSTDGASVRIANTGGAGAFVRRTPNLEDRLRAWPDGTPLRVVGPDATIDGLQWRPVEDPAGNQGWIPAEFTRVREAPQLP